MWRVNDEKYAGRSHAKPACSAWVAATAGMAAKGAKRGEGEMGINPNINKRRQGGHVLYPETETLIQLDNPSFCPYPDIGWFRNGLKKARTPKPNTHAGDSLKPAPALQEEKR